MEICEKIDSFRSISHLFREKKTFWQHYDDFRRDVMELWLKQYLHVDPIPVLFAKKLVRNLKQIKFQDNFLDEGLGSTSRYILIVVVKNNLIIDDLCKCYVNVYSNCLYNANHKFIISYELDVEEMQYVQHYLQTVYAKERWLFAKTIQV
jgi:hypothetical protein